MPEDLFASGTWVVKAEEEGEFLAAWNEFAEWTKRNAPGAGWVVLLRDQEHMNRYVSIGPWDSAADIEAWRASEGFRQRLSRLRGMVDDFEATRYERVSGVE